MKKIKNCKLDEKAEFENLSRLFSKPYSKAMLELSFKIVNSNVFDRLDRECFLNADDKKTYFDDERSVLYFKGEEIKINIQDKISNAHKILKHIFIGNKDNLEDDFFFSEIAEDEFGDTDYKEKPRGWQKYYIACKEINRKVKQQTKENVDNFLIFNTGRKGKIILNKELL